MLANGGWDLTLILLTWTIWRAPTNDSKWRMGFNSASEGIRGILAKYYWCYRPEEELGGGHARGRTKCVEFWYGNIKERGKLEDRVADSVCCNI